MELAWIRSRRPASSAGAALGAALLLAGIWAVRAGAAPCAGSGAAQCPYAGVQIIGQRAEGVLRFPEAVALDGSGDVYVADQLSYVVQKFNVDGEFETEWGSYGGGPGQFGPIGGLATDASGDVYVVDSSHNRIEKFGPAGNFITAWGHSGAGLGQFHFYSSQNPSQPPGGGIAVAGSHVYVADSGNDRIERFNLQGEEAIAWGSVGNGAGQFSYPRGVAADEAEVIVSDDDNHRLEKFSPEGAFEGAAGSHGSGPGQFGFPYGVALDAAGDVYVADDINHRVVKLNPQLAFAGAWGGLGSKPGQLAFPRALASDPAGDTYVADTANDRIEVFGPDGELQRTIGASGRDPGVLTAPRGVATDPTGGLLVSDTVGDRVELFAPGGDAFASAWTSAGGRRAGFERPAGIGVDPRGSVYVADEGNARLAHMWGDGSFLSEIGGPDDLGGAGLNGVQSVAVSPAGGNVYMADSGHNRILVYDQAGALLAHWGAEGGNGAGGSGPGEFMHPQGVAVAPSGNVYVADTNNNRVVELSGGGEVLAQWGSLGGRDGAFHQPTGVAVDAAGRVYVVDRENNRVEVFGPGGEFLYKWGIRGIFAGEFSQPTAIAIDCAGDVYVADTDNNRVERFQPVSPAASGCAPAGSWPPALDVAPAVGVRLARSSGVVSRRALALLVSCRRGCKILATATISPRARRAGVRLIAAYRTLPRALSAHVRLRLGPAGLRRIRRALGGASALTARVTIVAAGPTGRRTIVHRTFLVRR
jgi:tripartite motif-containing protein 71